jgi:hypothetical protein
MWEKRIKAANVFLVGSVLFFSASLFASDLKVKSLVTFTHKTADTYKTSESVRSSQDEETVYVRGPQERREYRVPDRPDVRQPHTAEISDCHTLNGYSVDFNARKYAEMKLPGFPSEEQLLAQARQQEKWAKKRYSVRSVESREKKTFFGLDAHHIITTIHGVTARERSEATIDGWYVNLPEAGGSPEYMRQGPGNELRASFLTIGPTKTVYTGVVPPGLAVQETITTVSRFEKNGFNSEFTTVVERKVVELSQESLEPALFNAPEGFEKVDRLPRNVNMPRPALRQR